jgi:hypothetical protein
MGPVWTTLHHMDRTKSAPEMTPLSPGVSSGSSCVTSTAIHGFCPGLGRRPISRTTTFRVAGWWSDSNSWTAGESAESGCWSIPLAPKSAPSGRVSRTTSSSRPLFVAMARQCPAIDHTVSADAERKTSSRWPALILPSTIACDRILPAGRHERGTSSGAAGSQISLTLLPAGPLSSSRHPGLHGG